MNTTAMIGEVITIGFLAAIWIILIILPITNITIDSEILENLFPYINVWVILLSFVVLLLFYQLGWIINGLCYYLMEHITEARRKERIKSEARIESSISYRQIRVFVYQHASQSLLTELNTDRAAMRIARTGILNFTLIAVALILFPGINAIYIIFPLAFAIMSIIESLRRSDRFYQQVIDSYCMLKNQ